MNYEFHPEAEAEHLEAVAYYEERRPGLGAKYLAEFERVVARICASPQRYPIERAPDIRWVSLHRFPFKVLFRSHNGKVQVLAVAHHRRRPAYWLGRV